MQFDYVIIGSGFGGSVSALRLAEKGYRVAVVEQGGHVGPDRIKAGARDYKKLLWMPGLGMDGYFSQAIFKHLGVVGRVGVGGGSLVYASVLLKPKARFYKDPLWSNLGIDWEKEMAPFYETASQMLGVTPNPGFDTMDRYLKKTARKMGVEKSFGPTPMGIYFDRPGITVNDPYFKGRGPERTGCRMCGECLAGCSHGSKNSLDKNYLFLARKKGVRILDQRKVVNIMPTRDGGYTLSMTHPLKPLTRYPDIRASKVIVAAGVLGSLALLFRCRDLTKTLPLISRQMGKVVRTNSEAIVGVLSQNPDIDLSKGTAISSDFYPDAHTHITQNRFPRGFSFQKWYFGPMVDHDNPRIRAVKTLGKMLARPKILVENWSAKNWHKRMTVLTVMQDLDNQISFKYKPCPSALFLKHSLKTVPIKGKQAPTNLRVANKAATTLAGLTCGIPLNIAMESLGNLSFTAHVLGGCHMGSSARNGVIDTSHQVFGHPGLYIMDGSAISANIGVNPSLTITAMAERAMGLVPPKNTNIKKGLR
ncbi:MAG: GMC family oxidoreductase [Desulfobacter sp.]|nr:GMC family oxidoreductase [Desulfobacter sp.]